MQCATAAVSHSKLLKPTTAPSTASAAPQAMLSVVGLFQRVRAAALAVRQRLCISVCGAPGYPRTHLVDCWPAAWFSSGCRATWKGFVCHVRSCTQPCIALKLV
mmetsp:Transcript_55547/g.107142  ORF Transcript_55547/g.107142 Transcript_55547/m.107142 type:complete len:104 (-) Transcript_55547:779-1090(-)